MVFSHSCTTNVRCMKNILCCIANNLLLLSCCWVYLALYVYHYCNNIFKITFLSAAKLRYVCIGRVAKKNYKKFYFNTKHSSIDRYNTTANFTTFVTQIQPIHYCSDTPSFDLRFLMRNFQCIHSIKADFVIKYFVIQLFCVTTPYF